MHSTPLFQKILSIALVICAVFTMFSVFAVESSAAPALPDANTETRHAKTATSLSADALSYYTGSNTFENLSKLSGASNTSTSASAAQNNPLYNALKSLMTSTHTFQTSYSGTSAGSLAYYWQRTDAQNGNAGSFVLVYSDKVISISSTSNFNREHVWPKSNASFNQSNGGSDLHHLRPADPTINSTRGNLPFGNVRSAGGSYTTGSCYWKTSSLFEPADNVKGDVARILLYVYVRWGENNVYSDTSNGSKIIESLDTLLAWIKLDPVDTWELKRNDLTQDVQGNRNVFIDYPELAYLMFGRTVPSDLVTPTRGTCSHNWVKQSETPPTCTEDGVTTYKCSKCGNTREEYTQANGHTEYKASETKATCTTKGTTRYVCSVCGNVRTVVTAALGHSYGAGTFTKDPTCTENGEISYPCTRCDYVKTEVYPAYGHEYSEGVTTVPATCTENGVKVYTCARCNDTKSEAVPALGHTDADRNGVCDRCGAEVEIPAALTLTNELTDGAHVVIYHPYQQQALSANASGTKLRGVSASPVNGEFEELPADAALFIAHSVGSDYYLVCNGQYLTTIATGNQLTLAESPTDYSIWRVEQASGDCVYLYNVNAAYKGTNNQYLEYYSGGYTVYGLKSTSNTDLYEYELFTTPGHVWDAGVQTAAPTCKDAGSMLYTCTLCGETQTREIPATNDHTPGAAVTENMHSASCTEDGSYDTVVYCTVCSEELSRRTVYLEAFGHEYVATTVQPTCTDDGCTVYTCAICGDFYEEILPANGHSWDEGTVTVPAGYGSEGTIVYRCTECDDTFTQTIPALEYIPGDVDLDGAVNITDVTALLDVISGLGSANLETADLDLDGVLTITDVSALLDLISHGHT